MQPNMKLPIFAAALAVSSLITGSAKADESPLRVRLNADIRSTDPGVNRDGNTDMVMSHLVEGLVAYSEDTTVVPMLAQRVETSEDGKIYTFTLREGVRFHNGATLTSADVAYAWARYLKPETGWRCFSDFTKGGVAPIASIETPDPRTVVFTLETATAMFLASMARVDCGQSGIWHRDSLKADGTWDTPIGTGPYMLGDWRQGQSITLKKFPDYSSLPGRADGLAGNKGEGPEEIRLMLIPDTSATKAALQAQSIDMVTDMDDRDAREVSAKPGLTLASASTLGVSGILLQTRDAVLDDVRIRRAMAMALDHVQLVEAVAGEGVSYNPSPIPEASGWHTDVQQQGYSYDPEGAMALLKDAGYDGEEIVIKTNTRYNSMYDVAVLSQAMMETVGLNVRFEVVDWATQLDAYSSGDFMAMAFSYSARYDAGLSFDMFSGDKDEQPRKIWDNAKSRALLAEALNALSPAERQPLLDRLHEMMIADVPAIWLYNAPVLMVYGPRVATVEPWATSAVRLWTVRLQ